MFFLNSVGLVIGVMLPISQNRLRAAGAVNVENPLRTALEQGTIEEIDEVD